MKIAMVPSWNTIPASTEVSNASLTNPSPLTDVGRLSRILIVLGVDRRFGATDCLEDEGDDIGGDEHDQVPFRLEDRVLLPQQLDTEADQGVCPS